MVNVNTNVVYFDGANAVGKTYAINKIVEGLALKYPGVRTRVVSIKEYYGDIRPETLSKIYSYKLQMFTHEEIMYIISKHKEMIEEIDRWVANDVYDVVIVDRSIISFYVYNILISRMLYTTDNVPNHLQYRIKQASSYVETHIKPKLLVQNNLYVHLRFNGVVGPAYMEQALVRTICRLEQRGVQDYTLNKIHTVVNLMEALHGMLIQDNDPGILLSSGSSDIHAYFPNVINTTSDHTDAILELL